MTPEERDRLAASIADELRRVAGDDAGPHDRRDAGKGTWLPVPVRPEPPARSSDPPTWAGAAQSLGDVAPIRTPSPSAHRTDAATLAADVRAAAAGRAARRGSGGDRSTAPRQHGSGGESRAPAAAPRQRERRQIDVPIGISRRHVHLSTDHLRLLFGSDQLDVQRAIRQPGQFAATQVVDVVGPGGRLEKLRVVGPARSETQLELARSDAYRLGIVAPVANSGILDGSSGGVTLIGTAGRVDMARGVIIAARHLHLAPGDAHQWRVRDGDRVDVRTGTGAGAVTWHEVLVRAGPGHATELHLDEDEAHAAGIRNGDTARIVGWHEARPSRRALVTERRLRELVDAGAPLPHGAIYTPGARDRARQLGISLP